MIEWFSRYENMEHKLDGKRLKGNTDVSRLDDSKNMEMCCFNLSVQGKDTDVAEHASVIV